MIRAEPPINFIFQLTMSQSRIRSFLRTKQWYKCVTYKKKPFVKKSYFSTQAVPSDYYESHLTDVRIDVAEIEFEKKISTIESEPSQSPDESITSTVTLDINDPTTQSRWPMYSVLDRNGRLLKGAVEPTIEKNKVIEMYNVMSRVQTLDDVFFNAQRQGRISFYMQSSGEEATQIGKFDLVSFFIKP